MGAVVLFLVAFSARGLSQQWSPLPYNIDGLSEFRVSQGIISSGNLDFPSGSSVVDGYVSDLPILGLFSAYFSSLTGSDPLSSLQVLSALIGSVAVLLVFLIFRQHWKSQRGAIATALVLALVGTFAFSAGCTWKETLGFVLVGLALYAFPLRNQIPYRALLTLSLVLAPFTHHYVTIVLFVIVTFALVFSYLPRRDSAKNPIKRELVLDASTIVGAWALTAFYYSWIKLPYLDYLSPHTDLYLYIAVAFLLLLVGIRLAIGSRPLLRSLPLGLLIPAVGALIMAINYFHPIFPGLPAPSSLILVPVLGYLILVAPAWEGARAVLGPRGPTKNLLLAMLIGPLSLILFAFLRSNDATSQLIIYRTFDFLMPAFALLVGVGFALMLKGWGAKVGMAAGVSLVIVCASTLPVAYSSQELFGVENQTFWFEYDAVKWFSEHGVGDYTSDQRLGETGWRLFDLGYGRGLPYDLREGLALNSSSFFVVEDSWSTKGAQEFPFGVVVVPSGTISAVLNESSVVFIGGPSNNHISLFGTG